MRKMNPAVKSVLAASLAMGAGTGIVVGLDVMTHGTIPAAVAADETGNLPVSYEAPATKATDANGNVAQLDTTDDSFRSTGTIRVYATGSATKHTGPFTIKFALPSNWVSEGGTFRQPTHDFDTDNSFDDVAKHAKLSFEDDNQTCVLTVGGEGLKGGQQIVVNYAVQTTTRSTVTIDNQDVPFNHSNTTHVSTMTNKLNPIEFSTTVTMKDDWSAPDYNSWIDVPTSTVGSTSPTVEPTPTGTVKLAMGKTYGTGYIYYTFTGNAARARLTTVTLDGEADSAIHLVNVGSTYMVKRAGTSEYSEAVSCNQPMNFKEGDVARLSFDIAVDADVDALAKMFANKTVTLSSHITVEGDSTDSAMDSSLLPVGARAQETVSAQIGLATARLDVTGVTLHGDTLNASNEVTMGDEIYAEVPVKATGYVHSGKLRVTLGTDDATSSVKITGVASASGTPLDSSTYAIDSTGKYVDVNLSAFKDSQTTTYRILVKCGDDASQYEQLNGKTIPVNTAVALLDGELEAQSASAQFKIAAPSAEITTQVTDPNVQLPDNNGLTYKDAIVSNLGDTARFQVTFKNTSDQAIKDIKLHDTLSIKTKTGTELLNSTGCVDILPNTAVLTKIHDGNSTAVNATIGLVDADSTGHPYHIDVTPAPALNLAPGDLLVLQYDAKIGHTEIASSNGTMRGSTVTNAPTMDDANYANVTLTQPSSVTVATAELAVNLTANKEKITTGENATYVMTIQSVEQWTTNVNDEYAIGLHMTSVLDEFSHTYGYQYDLGKVKLYHVHDGSFSVIPSNAYEVAWVEQDKDKNPDAQDQLSFTLDINEAKANSYKIRNVNKPATATEIQDVTQSDDQGSAGGESVGGAEATDDETTTAAAQAEATSKDDASKSDDIDVATLAQKLKFGYIITFDGTTENVVKGFAGTIDSNTYALARADNAGFAMDSQAVTIVGDEIMAPETGGKVDPNSVTNQGSHNANGTGTNGRQTTPVPLSPTGVDAPTSLGILAASVAGLAYTWYRKIRRR